MSRLKALSIISVLLCTQSAVAGQWVTREVNRLLTDSQTITDSQVGQTVKYGGCAAKLNSTLANTSGLSECGEWVTFDCGGAFASKSRGVTSFTSAQLAQVAGLEARIFVDNTKSINGFCWASSIAVCREGTVCD